MEKQINKSLFCHRRKNRNKVQSKKGYLQKEKGNEI